MSSEAARFNVGKLRWSLLEYSSLESLVRVLEFGAQKYDDENWKKGMKFTQVFNSLMRHLISWRKGEDVDSESGENHLSHVMANAMFLLYYQSSQELSKRFDDRCSSPSDP